MVQTGHGYGSYFPIPPNINSQSGGQRNRGGRGPNFGQNGKMECQICGKNNMQPFFVIIGRIYSTNHSPGINFLVLKEG